MKTKICQNCKYWGKIGTGYVTNNKNYRGCNCPKFAYKNFEEGEKDNLVYSDYEGFSAGLGTGAEFGCIHFTQKKV